MHTGDNSAYYQRYYHVQRRDRRHMLFHLRRWLLYVWQNFRTDLWDPELSSQRKIFYR
jgi:hypothetical protein